MDSSEKCVVLATRDKVEFRVPVSLFPNSSEEKITASWYCFFRINSGPFAHCFLLSSLHFL